MFLKLIAEVGGGAVVLPPAATSRCNRNAGTFLPAATFCCRFLLLRLKDCTHRQRVFIPPHPATAAPSPCSLSLSCRLNPLQLPPQHQTPQSHLRPKLQHLPRRRRRQQSVASLRHHCLLAQALQLPPPFQRHLLLHLHPNQQLLPPQQFSPKTPKLPPASAVLCQKVIHLLFICCKLTSNNHNDTRLHGPCMWPVSPNLSTTRFSLPRHVTPAQLRWRPNRRSVPEMLRWRRRRRRRKRRKRKSRARKTTPALSRASVPPSSASASLSSPSSSLCYVFSYEKEMISETFEFILQSSFTRIAATSFISLYAHHFPP